MLPEYPWYAEVADGTLDQGDILAQCPAGYLPTDWDPDRADQSIRLQVFDLIVLTQACDLGHEKTDYVVCCPVFDHGQIDAEFPGQSPKYIATQKDRIRQGVMPGYAMIAAHAGTQSRPVSIVDFRKVFGMPRAFLQGQARSPHLRLLPPYREHISQSFARFFMRVGLPKDIPSFKAW